MTVKELIAELQQQPEWSRVAFSWKGDWTTIIENIAFADGVTTIKVSAGDERHT